MASLVLLGVAALAVPLMFLPRLQKNTLWRATVTPLASIIGSGFLLAGPVLGATVGPWAIPAMAGLIAMGYLFGETIRYNIRHVEPLIAKGSPRLLVGVDEVADVPQVRDRLDGAREALAPQPEVSLTVFETLATTVLEGRRVGEQVLSLSASDRPDAIFAANDLVAIGLLQAFMASPDIRVPDDIALIGYDDIDFSPSAIVPLTSIRQPSRLMGQTALDILNSEALDATAKPQEVVFQPELIVRSST